MYLYLNLKQFNKEDEQLLKARNKNIDFNFANYKLDPVYNECKFPKAIEELKKISLYQTPFEKLKVLCDVNSILYKEAKESLENKINFLPTGDNLWVIWTYLVIHSEIKNVLTEVSILQNFKIKDSFLEGESGCHLTYFIAAVDNLNKSDSEKKCLTVKPYIVNNNNYYNADKDFSFGNKTNVFAKDVSFEEDKSRTINNITNTTSTSGIMGTFKSMFSK